MLTLSGITAFIAVCILLTLLLWVAASVLVRIVQGLVATPLLKGFEQSSLVLALGITALVFGDTLDQVVRVCGEVLVQLYRVTSAAVAHGLKDGGWLDEQAFEQNLAGLERSASAGLYSIPIASILVCLAAFVVIAGIVDGGQQAGHGSGSLARLRSWYSGLQPVARRRVVLGSTLALGAYLSLAAIVAIPWLETVGKDARDTSTELRQRLETERMTAQVFDARWPRELSFEKALDGLALLEASKPADTVRASAAPEAPPAVPAAVEADGPPPPPAPAEPSPAPQPTAAADPPATRAPSATPKEPARLDKQRQELVLILKANLSDVQKRWIDARDYYGTLSAASLQQALEAYERYEDADLTDRERQLFVDSLVRWYRDTLARYEMQLGWHKRELESYVDQVTSWTRNPPSGEVLDVNAMLPRPVVDNFSVALRALGTGENAVPTPLDITGLGIFGFIANWLVRTRSFSLALISGMIGFGLFGSAASRAVASFSKARAHSDEHLQTNPFDLLLVGTSSAVIIFLASQGGLAVVATGGTHSPNPYVLFLGCFLGAVFGERVWEVARVRFYGALQEHAAPLKPPDSRPPAEPVPSDNAAPESDDASKATGSD
jgi:hypothetical protein